MEKDLFIAVLKHYSKSSEGEALNILSLKEDFPYCQLLHTLSARLSKDHGLVDQSRELQLAAVYAADRGILRDVMTLDNIVVEARYKAPAKLGNKEIIVNTPRVLTGPAAKEITTVGSNVEIEHQPQIPGINKEEELPENPSMAEQVMNDLERLHELKLNYETMFIDTESPGIEIPSEPAIEKDAAPPGIESSESEDEALRQSSKSKRERIIELAKALEASKKNEQGEEVETVKTKRTNAGENIIEEIVSTKHEIEPESPKQKEQLQIIEQFIKTQPSISNSKDKPIPAPGADLSTIKTGEFSDNIVSETLVEILLKQGKKDKAIEVLKKLIWKFPQKKAYFAAQIEELKK